MTQFELPSIESHQIACSVMIGQAHCPALSAPTPTSPLQTQIPSPPARRATPMKVQTLCPPASPGTLPVITTATPSPSQLADFDSFPAYT